MELSYQGLKKLLQNHIVELTFVRRNPKLGWPNNRRMLCTTSRLLLDSLAGRVAFNFKPPTNPPPYIAEDYELIVAWDLMWQDFRAIPNETAFVINAIPVRNKKEIDQFWLYFDKALKPMTPQEKNKFMKT